MSDETDNDTRPKENPEGQDDVTEIEGGSLLDGLKVGDGYGSGLPLILQPDRDSEEYAVGTNSQGGFGEESVKALQTYITQELDSKWDGNEHGNTKILPDFGIDGAWGCETQAAYNKLLESKKIECKEGGSSPCGEGVPACGVSDEILDKLRESEEKKEEDDAAEAVEEAPTYDFSDQCFLLTNIAAIIEKTGIRKETYKYIHKIATQDPATLMNILRMTKGGMDFLNIRHWELSGLTPTIRVYKRYYDVDSKEPRDVEFKFNSFVDPITDLQEMLNSQLQRGVGVGIDRFDWSLVGVQPETQKKDIKATLVLQAQNFNEIFKTRDAVDHEGKIKEGGYRMIDLIVLEPMLKKEDGTTKQRTPNPNFYEIKIVVGWASTGASSIISEDLRSALKNTQLTMYLILEEHNFDFKDDGSVKLSLDYRARIESLMLDNRSDVLANKETRDRRQKRKDLVDEVRRASAELGKDKKPCTEFEERIAVLTEDYSKYIKKERESAQQFLTKELLEGGKIYSAKISYKDLKEDPEISTTGAQKALDLLSYVCKDAVAVDISDTVPAEEITHSSPVDGERRVNFFFLGDLFDGAINNVLDRKELYYGDIKFLLGPVQFPDPNPRSTNILNENLAHFPISMELYAHFIEKKLSRKSFDSYPLLLFMRDVIKTLIFEVLGPECYAGSQSPSFVLDTAQITADAKSGEDPIEQHIKDGQLNLDDFGRDKEAYVFESFNDSFKKYDYFVLYAFQGASNKLSYEESELKGTSRMDLDFNKGIYHLTTGLDRGLVRKMSFNKTDFPYLREARYFESDSSPELQLSKVYNCDVEMYGNNLFYPGQHVFINPRGLGSDLLGDPTSTGDDTNPSWANIMGLGGYHVVVSTSNTIDLNGFKTSLKLLFETSGDGIPALVESHFQLGDEVLEPCVKLETAINKLSNEIGGG